MRRAHLALGTAAAVAFGMVASAPAALACDPVHDPHCKPKYRYVKTVVAGAKADLNVEAWGNEGYYWVKEGSYVEDTLDDGKDAHLWISYIQTNEDGTTTPVKKVLAIASGLGTKTYFTWSGAEVWTEVEFRACNGPEEALCDEWRERGEGIAGPD